MKPRVLGALIGDLEREPGARTKFGQFFAELARQVTLVAVHDATLRGPDRWLNALQAFHPDPRRWRERFYQNGPAFAARSRHAAAFLHTRRSQVDVSLQLGTLFDLRWEPSSIPNVIYTDYTAALAARRPEAGRSPFTPGQRRQWLALERAACQRAAHVCTRSALVRQSVIDDYGLPAEQVSTIGGGLNFPALPVAPDRRGRAAPVALFIGKEFRRKGGEWLLRAFAQVRRRLPRARLRLVTAGRVPPNLPLENVEVVAATWDRAAIARLYEEADVFVLPSLLETWGDVLLEAMAYGLPCIGVAGQAMEEIIRPGQTGLIVPPGDEAALAEALAQLLADAERRQYFGQNARQRVEMDYTWSRVVGRLAPILDNAHLRNGSSGAP